MSAAAASLAWRRSLGRSPGSRWTAAPALATAKRHGSFSSSSPSLRRIYLLRKHLFLVDTQTMVSKLVAEGVRRKHAEAVAEVLREDLNNLAITEIFRCQTADIVTTRPSAGLMPGSDGSTWVQKMRLEARGIPPKQAGAIAVFLRDGLNYVRPFQMSRSSPTPTWQLMRMESEGIPMSHATAIANVMRDGLDNVREFVESEKLTAAGHNTRGYDEVAAITREMEEHNHNMVLKLLQERDKKSMPFLRILDTNTKKVWIYGFLGGGLLSSLIVLLPLAIK